MKTKSNRYKEESIADIKIREIDWKFIIVFLLGAIFSEITADPFSDVIFFWRESTGVPMTPFEQIFYWYYMPTIAYGVFFAVAIATLYVNKMSPKSFMYVIFIFSGLSLGLSLYFLGFDPIIVILLVVPLVALFLFVSYELIIYIKGKSVVI